MVAAALTRGDITLENCEPEHLDALIHKLRLAGARILVSGKTIRVRVVFPDCRGPVTVTTGNVWESR